MSGGTVLSLCDLTGAFVEPWVEDGYQAVLVDPQHHYFSEDGPVTRLAMTVDEAMREIRELLTKVVFVAAFPPCTNLAVSGARWFGDKQKENPTFQMEAVAVAEQCRTIGRLSGAPYFVENPVSVLSSVWGKPDFTFNPSDYTALESGDNYTKKTCLWAGNGYRHPAPQIDPTLGDPDDRIHKAPPGPERANFRSATPRGFARAAYNEATERVPA